MAKDIELEALRAKEILGLKDDDILNLDESLQIGTDRFALKTELIAQFSLRLIKKVRARNLDPDAIRFSLRVLQIKFGCDDSDTREFMETPHYEITIHELKSRIVEHALSFF